jgi:hypothetical protein
MTKHSPFRAGLAAVTLTWLALLAPACDDGDDAVNPERTDARPTIDGSIDENSTREAGSEAGDGADGGLGDGGASDTATPTTRAAGVAILSSDRKSTSLSLAAIDGTGLVKDHCLHSGSASPKLSAALSGDVVLPTAAQPGHEIALIDRKNSTITWAAPDTCEVLRQMNVGTGFSANPYDLIAGPGGKGFVPRYNSNPGNAAEGSDVLVIDTATAVVTGRIDLRASAGPNLPPAMPLLPFPTRGVLAAGKIYVALNNFSADYSTSGPGRLVAIDPASNAVTDVIELPGLKNCGVVDLGAGTGGPALALAVGCSGPFGDGPAQIDSAGIAWIDLSVSPASVTVVKSMAFARPVSGFDVAALNKTFAATVVPGDFDKPPGDAVFALDFAGGPPRKIYQADTSFSLAIGLDHDGQRLYVLDASKTAPRVHVFTLPLAAGAAPTRSFLSNALAGLPPRQLMVY